MKYYKNEYGELFTSETDREDLIAITKKEYDALAHKKEVCAQLAALKFELKRTDYVVIKIAEAATQEDANALRQEYSDVIAHRISTREQINQLELELK